MNTLTKQFDKHLLKENDRTYYTNCFDFMLKKNGKKWSMYEYDEVYGVITGFIAQIDDYQDFLDNYFLQTLKEYE